MHACVLVDHGTATLGSAELSVKAHANPYVWHWGAYSRAAEALVPAVSYTSPSSLSVPLPLRHVSRLPHSGPPSALSGGGVPHEAGLWPVVGSCSRASVPVAQVPSPRHIEESVLCPAAREKVAAVLPSCASAWYLLRTAPPGWASEHGRRHWPRKRNVLS